MSSLLLTLSFMQGGKHVPLITAAPPLQGGKHVPLVTDTLLHAGRKTYPPCY